MITEAMHSWIDLVASVVAYVWVRNADKPADAPPLRAREDRERRGGDRGHADPRRRGVIVFEAVRRLIQRHRASTRLGVGIGVLAVSRRQRRRLAGLARRAAAPARRRSAADAAHLRTDALTLGGVLVGLVIVQLTGGRGSTPWSRSGRRGGGDRRRAASSARLARARRRGPARSRARRDPRGGRRVRRRAASCGFHKLRARRAGRAPLRRPARAVRRGHDAGSRPRDRPRAAGRDPRAPPRADVLIHLEPEDACAPDQEITTGDALAAPATQVDRRRRADDEETAAYR